MLIGVQCSFEECGCKRVERERIEDRAYYIDIRSTAPFLFLLLYILVAFCWEVEFYDDGSSC